MKKKIALLSLSSLLLVACGEQNTKANSTDQPEIEELENQLAEANKRIEELESELEGANTNQESSESENKGDQQAFGLNEEMVIGDETTDAISLKVTEVTNNISAFPDYMQNLTDEYDLNKAIAVTIEYSNLAYGATFAPSTHDFQIFNASDGAPFERISQQSGGDEVTEGRSGTTQIYFYYPEGIDNVDEVEIDYSNQGNYIGTFNTEVTK
ncbi:hypothetical protein FEZ48_07475 [Marinilactibacillus psychrotolerans]|uniref:DUF4352 domain-containing protein n=1 Tax=Marinilactibacillus psychrotolerans TaxID=191770 RepID=A0A5R9C2Y8_9LACT|nr:hypothetical protein [Marinilactibacillus psychrotolerans]TLQ07085.1 hypothetical protein FEZ48_07475 [Marinilactibacillus psychrotolerans]